MFLNYLDIKPLFYDDFYSHNDSFVSLVASQGRERYRYRISYSASYCYIKVSVIIMEFFIMKDSLCFKLTALVILVSYYFVATLTLF